MPCRNLQNNKTYKRERLKYNKLWIKEKCLMNTKTTFKNKEILFIMIKEILKWNKYDH